MLRSSLDFEQSKRIFILWDFCKSESYIRLNNIFVKEVNCINRRKIQTRKYLRNWVFLHNIVSILLLSFLFYGAIKRFDPFKVFFKNANNITESTHACWKSHWKQVTMFACVKVLRFYQNILAQYSLLHFIKDSRSHNSAVYSLATD